MKVYSFIKLSHLPALGLEQSYFYMIVLALSIILVYTIMQPFIQWLVTLKLTRLLSYLVSNLFLLNVICLILVWKPDMREAILNEVEQVFQAIAIFGIGLAVYYTVRKLIGRT